MADEVWNVETQIIDLATGHFSMLTLPVDLADLMSGERVVMALEACRNIALRVSTCLGSKVLPPVLDVLFLDHVRPVRCVLASRQPNGPNIQQNFARKL